MTYPIYVGELPVVGGGGDFKLTLGHPGSVIGFSGVWRGAEKAFDAKRSRDKKRMNRSAR